MSEWRMAVSYFEREMGNRGVWENQELTGNTIGSLRRSGKVKIADEINGKHQPETKRNGLLAAMVGMHQSSRRSYGTTRRSFGWAQSVARGLGRT
jgi:hypothetical protein